MQDFSGGEPNSNFLGNLDIHAAKLRAVARGVWGMPPLEISFKMAQFRAF